MLADPHPNEMSKHLIQHLQPTRTRAVHYVYISGFCILVRFLHELLLPWFAVRNGIRCNDHKALDWSWSYFLPLFHPGAFIVAPEAGTTNSWPPSSISAGACTRPVPRRGRLLASVPHSRGPGARLLGARNSPRDASSTGVRNATAFADTKESTYENMVH